MGSPEDLVSHHVTVLRRCGLSDEDICEVYGVTDPPDDVSVGRIVLESLDGEPTPKNLYDQTHRVLATATRGIDAPRDYSNRVVPQQLNTVMGAFGFSMYFLDDSGEPLDSGADPSQPFRIALEDPNGNVRTTTFEYPETALGEQNYPALVAAVQNELLDGVPLTFVMLSDWAEDRWRFVLLEGDRLDALEEHYGDGIECFGEPLLHEHSPAEFASGQAVEEPAVEATAGDESSEAADESDGDIGVDESTEGWLGRGGSDLSNVDLEGSGGDDTAETADEPTVETGLEDIFSTIEEDANAGGEGSVEIESTGKTVEDLVGADTTGATDETTGEPAAEPEPEPATEAEPEPAAPAEPEPATEAEPEPAAPAEPEPATEAEPTPVTDEQATAESGSVDADDDGGFVTADPEPARAETAETAAADPPAESADESVDEGPADAAEPEQPAADAEVAADPAAGSADTAPDPAVEPTSGSAESEEAAGADTPADAPAAPAESGTEPSETVTPEPATAEPEPVDATAAADEATGDEPTARTGGDPTAAAESTTATEDSAADDGAATADSDDSPGLVGRIVGAIKGLF
ncbi:hypothetical protein [Haloarchaeobius sp. FL176]|uniref:hypothetical protein n=1 Tax=Haloarchaeobius sp. FL176 TaxID=2967129 RepID=UPI002148DBF6|nr:hypothetical protein [Haloarchaeobius sp. FL176]